MERIKLPGVTDEARAAVRELVDKYAHDEAVMAKNKRIMLVALINKGILRKPTTSHRHPRRRR